MWCTRIYRLDDNVGVEKMAGNHVRCERCVAFLEDDSYNIVANVALTLQLLAVILLGKVNNWIDKMLIEYYR